MELELHVWLARLDNSQAMMDLVKTVQWEPILLVLELQNVFLVVAEKKLLPLKPLVNCADQDSSLLTTATVNFVQSTNSPRTLEPANVILARLVQK